MVRVGFLYSVTLALACAITITAFPAHKSLAGLSREQLTHAMANLKRATPPPPPGPLAFDGTKLVNDANHPYQAPGKGDMRGACPALNALASHGYINRDGIVSPSDIVSAAMEGFNMEHNVAVFTTYAAFIVDGNLITDLLSIGEQTNKTGPAPPSPALAAGLNTHNVFEGDSSMTRQDAYFGNNHDFNETLFQSFIEYSNQYGGGKYNLTAASEFRLKLFQDCIATNPEFTIVAPRFYSAYNDAVLPINLWVDGRQDDGHLDIDVARTFFQGRFPDDFYRAARPTGANNKIALMDAHPMQPGSNVNGINTYTPDLTTPQNVEDICEEYTYHVNNTVRSLYPNPDGPLLDALKTNLGYLYSAVKDVGCTEIFLYGE